MPLVMHCGGKEVTRQRLDLIQLPEETESYKPVSHGYFVDRVQSLVADYRQDWKLRSEKYGLNKNGAQFFFSLNYDVAGVTQHAQVDLREPEAQHSLSIVGRNSIDKSLSAGLASGALTLACDNLALYGDSFRVLRKHTRNVVEDLDPLIKRAIDAAQPAYLALNAMWERLRQTDVSLERGYEIMGRMLGSDVLKPQQATEAFRAWRDNRFDFGRTLYGLYQQATDGAKQGAPGEKIEVLAGIHAFFVREGQAVAAQAPLVLHTETVSVALPTGLEID